MKQDWRTLPFEKSIVKVKYTTKIASTDYLKSGLYPIISQEEGLINGYWNNEKDVFKVYSPIIVFGDHTRILKYVDFDFVIGADGVKILQPINKINAKFLKYYIESCRIPSLGYSRHYKLLKKISVPIPPMIEQERIVAELDLLSDVIAKKREQLKQLDTLAQSIFYDMFGDPITNEKGWKQVSLVDICKNTGVYGAGSSSMPKQLYRPRYVRITDILDSGDLNDDFVVSSNVEDDETYRLNVGDILFARSGATVGKTYLYRGNEAQIYAGYLIKFSLNILYVNPIFIFYITKNRSYKLWISKQIIGVAQPNINAQKYGKLPIILPPLALQQQFASMIESIEKQKELIKQSLSEVQQLFDSRMDYYFG